MAREEQLVFCKQCSNRKMDFQQGLICSLTDAKATFTGECPDYSLDSSTQYEHDSSEVIDNGEVRIRISTELLEKLRLEQNLPVALIAGTVTGIAGAILWGAITVATNFQIGYMAIAIGAAVGMAMRYTGKGIDPIFGFAGGALAVLSCILGNFLSVIGFIANSEGLDFMYTLTEFDYNYLVPLMQETFSFMDLVFYGIAGYEGYKFAFRSFTDGELDSLN
ncbi:hypothetical protein SAMN04488028_10456 [Reichenbachiella agariperforans]|uniref:Uncharacterized protein n=1 Tax=Reichenbachiella agariperforans TaxID=156994 RepID=A0A1M6R6L4_REIAG|nr:hypothetical protein [Reichenbachiella agariperforans]SHK28083.1 hypothetical protein SAMN04488028_10456 [Reichenbachiella agariperforans]